MKSINEYIQLLAVYMQTHASVYHIKRMGIFGSVARGEQTENSDIDIAWFTNKPVDYSTLSSYEFDLCELLGREVDLVIPDKNNIYFLLEVLSSPPIYIGNDNFTDWLDRFNDWVLDEYKFIENVILEKCDLI